MLFRGITKCLSAGMLIFWGELTLTSSLDYFDDFALDGSFIIYDLKDKCVIQDMINR